MLNDLPASPPTGGAEVVLDRLTVALGRDGHDVRVHTRPGARTGVAKVGALWDPAEGRRVARLVADLEPDVVHLHNVLRELSAAVLPPLADVPVVMTVHDLRIAGVVLGQRSAPERLLDGRLKQPRDTRLVRRVVDHYVAVGPVLAQALQDKGFGPISVIEPPAPDWPAPTTRPSQSRDLAVVCRLSPDKGVGVALAAFGALDPAVRGRLLVAGDGPLRAALEASAPEGVTFLGRVPSADLPGLLAGVRAVLVPSLPAVRPETSSLTAIEAAWCGRPVVCSDDPATAALVTRLGAGVVVPAGDVAALTAALADLLADDVRTDALGAAGATAVRSAHAADAVAARYVEVYREAGAS
jgi:glycosyltransferase involved in cell wall biosynthesis